MKAARIDRYGGTDVIRVVADADRPLSPMAVCRRSPASSLIPLTPCSGLVHHGMCPAVPRDPRRDSPAWCGGEQHKGFARDDEVYGQANALLGDPALAELVAASAAMTALKPKTVDFKTAASLPWWARARFRPSSTT